VYVCEASDENPARLIHQRVWNQNVAPFILVETRGNVYLYSGFRYESPSEDEAEQASTTGVLRSVAEFNQNMQVLESFKAEAIDDGALWREWGRKSTPKRGSIGSCSTS